MIPVLADFPAIFRSCNVDRNSSNAKKKHTIFVLFMWFYVYSGDGVAQSFKA